MKKLLCASLFYGVFLSGMGMGDIETLKVIAQQIRSQKKQTPQKRCSMDALDSQNKNYQTMNNDKATEKKEAEETNWRSFFFSLCCIPQDR